MAHSRCSTNVSSVSNGVSCVSRGHVIIAVTSCKCRLQPLFSVQLAASYSTSVSTSLALPLPEWRRIAPLGAESSVFRLVARAPRWAGTPLRTDFQGETNISQAIFFALLSGSCQDCCFYKPHWLLLCCYRNWSWSLEENVYFLSPRKGDCCGVVSCRWGQPKMVSPGSASEALPS